MEGLSLSVLFQEATIGPILLSLKVLAGTVFLHLIFGVGIGYILSRRFPFRGLLDSLIVFPLIFPPVGTGFFLLLILGKKGLLGRALEGGEVEVVFTFWGVLLAAFIAGLPLIVKPVQAAIESSAKSLAEASYVLGKGEVVTFVKVILPTIKRTVMSGLTLSSGRALGEVGITLMLGGNIEGKTDTISLAIYNAVFEGAFDRAIVLSLLLAFVSVALLIVLRRMGSI